MTINEVIRRAVALGVLASPLALVGCDEAKPTTKPGEATNPGPPVNDAPKDAMEKK